jgi:hypothetical protein
MSVPTDEKRVAEIAERVGKATGGLSTVQITRYEHGGGRIFLADGDSRELIADLYDEGNREFVYHAFGDIAYLLSLVASLSRRAGEADELRKALQTREMAYLKCDGVVCKCGVCGASILASQSTIDLKHHCGCPFYILRGND